MKKPQLEFTIIFKCQRCRQGIVVDSNSPRIQDIGPVVVFNSYSLSHIMAEAGGVHEVQPAPSMTVYLCAKCALEFRRLKEQHAAELLNSAYGQEVHVQNGGEDD